MAKHPKFPTTREQKFAYFLAKGLTCAESARRAGYAPTTIRSNAYQLTQRPHIQELVSQYRQSLGFIDAHMLHTCLEELKAIAGDDTIRASDRFAAINRLIQFYEDFNRHRDWSTGIPAYLFEPDVMGTKHPPKYPSKPPSIKI